MKRARPADASAPSSSPPLPSLAPAYPDSLLFGAHSAPLELLASGSLGYTGDACGLSGPPLPGFAFPHGRASALISAAVGAADSSAAAAAAASEAGWGRVPAGTPRVAACAAWDEPGALLAVGCGDGMVQVWDTAPPLGGGGSGGEGGSSGSGALGRAGWRTMALLGAHDGAVLAAAWCPCAAAEAAQLRASGIEGGGGSGPPPLLLPPARFLATAGADCVLRVWRFGPSCGGGGGGASGSGGEEALPQGLGAVRPSLVVAFALPSAPVALSFAPELLPHAAGSGSSLALAAATLDGPPTLVLLEGQLLLPPELGGGSRGDGRAPAGARLVQLPWAAPYEPEAAGAAAEVDASGAGGGGASLHPEGATEGGEAAALAGSPDGDARGAAQGGAGGREASPAEAAAAAEAATATPAGGEGAGSKEAAAQEDGEAAAVSAVAAALPPPPPLLSQPSRSRGGKKPAPGRRGKAARRIEAALRPRVAILPTLPETAMCLIWVQWHPGSSSCALICGTSFGRLHVWREARACTSGTLLPLRLVPAALLLAPGLGGIRSLEVLPAPRVPRSAGGVHAGAKLRVAWEAARWQMCVGGALPGVPLSITGGHPTCPDPLTHEEIAPALTVQLPLLVATGEGGIYVLDGCLPALWAPRGDAAAAATAAPPPLPAPVPLLACPVLCRVPVAGMRMVGIKRAQWRSVCRAGGCGRDGTVLLALEQENSGRLGMGGASHGHAAIWAQQLSWAMGTKGSPVAAACARGEALPLVHLRYLRARTEEAEGRLLRFPLGGLAAGRGSGEGGEHHSRQHPDDAPLSLLTHPYKSFLLCFTRYGAALVLHHPLRPGLGITELNVLSGIAIAAAQRAGGKDAGTVLEAALSRGMRSGGGWGLGVGGALGRRRGSGAGLITAAAAAVTTGGHSDTEVGFSDDDLSDGSELGATAAAHFTGSDEVAAVTRFTGGGLLLDSPATLAAVRELFGGGGSGTAPPPHRSAAAPLTVTWGAYAPFLTSSELSINVAYAEREAEFDVEGGSLAAAAAATAERGAPANAGGLEPKEAVEDVDVLNGEWGSSTALHRPLRAVTPLSRIGCPPFSSQDAVLLDSATPTPNPAPLLPFCSLAPLAIAAGRLAGPAPGAAPSHALRHTRTVWVREAAAEVAQRDAAPPLWGAASATALAGRGGPPLSALLRASLQAEGLRGLACATERRVPVFMMRE